MNEIDNQQDLVNGNLRNAIESLWVQINSSVQQINDLKEDNAFLRANNREIEQKLSQNTKAENELLEEILKLEENNNILTDNLDKKDLEISNIKSELQNKNELETDSNKQKEELRKQKEKIISLEEESFNYSHLQKEIARKNIDLNTKQVQIEDLNEAIANLKSKVYSFEDLEHKNSDQSSLIADIKSENVKLLQNLSEITTERFENETLLKDKISKCETTIEQQSNSLKNYSDKLYENNRDKANLLKKIEQSKINYENINTSLNKSLEENSHLESKLKEFDVYKKMLEVKEKDMQQLRFDLEKSNSVKIALETKLNQMEFKINDLINKETDLNLIIEKKEKQVLESLSLKDYNKQQLSKAEKILAELSSQVSEKSKKLYEYQNIEKVKNDLELDLTEQKSKNKRLELEYDLLVNTNDEKDKEITSLKNELFLKSNVNDEYPKKDLELFNQRLNMRDESIKKLSHDKEELENIIKTRYEQIQILEEQINKKEATNKDLKGKQTDLAHRLTKVLSKIHILNN